MNFFDAMGALGAYKKIRRKYWLSEEYKTSLTQMSSSVLCTSYSITNPGHTFIALVEHPKKIAGEDEPDITIMKFNTKGEYAPLVFSPEDQRATDWEVVQ